MNTVFKASKVLAKQNLEVLFRRYLEQMILFFAPINPNPLAREYLVKVNIQNHVENKKGKKRSDLLLCQRMVFDTAM